MKNKLIVLIALSGVFVACSQNKKVGSDDASKSSYALGYDLGLRIPQVLPMLDDVDKDQFTIGFRDALDKNPQLSEDEIDKLAKEVRASFDEKSRKTQEGLAEKNKADGEKFLAQNKTKEGVKATGSGLQYKIVRQGKGKKPTATDRVEVNYEGTLLDGTEFDSSYKRGESITFGLNQVIAGWTEGLQYVNEGGEIMLYIPSNLAYGPNGGRTIGPNATLIFKVELIKVNP